MALASSFSLAISASSFGRGLPVPFRLAGFFDQFVDGVDRLLHFGVTEHNSAQHDFFGQLLGFGFDHQHGGFGTGDDQVELAGSLSWLRVGHSTYWPSM